MKTTVTVVIWAIASATLAPIAASMEYSVGSCADLMAVDETALTSLVVTSSSIECDDYLRFVVRNNMTLTTTVPDAVVISNVALKIKPGLVVVIEPDIEFRNVFEVVKNGGALSISEESNVTFMRTAKFVNNSVLVKPLCQDDDCSGIARGISFVAKKGGAIHNKVDYNFECKTKSSISPVHRKRRRGRSVQDFYEWNASRRPSHLEEISQPRQASGELIFQEDASFLECYSQTFDSVETSRGGAISNNAPGVIRFMSDLRMEFNEAEGFFEGQGGAIYNRGDIIVDGDATFFKNSASDGGGLYQENWATFTVNGMANFTKHNAFEFCGGAICNRGGEIDIIGGSVFDRNYASSSGEGGDGGAISNTNGGVVTLTGPTTFSSNGAYYGGAIYNPELDFLYLDDEELEDFEPPVVTYPSDTVFIDNKAQCGPDVYDGDFASCPDS